MANSAAGGGVNDEDLNSQNSSRYCQPQLETGNVETNESNDDQMMM